MRFADVETLAAVIARSLIVVPCPNLLARQSPRRRLPAAFEGADIAILEWIAAEGRRVGRTLTWL
jgi:hypothetical protein